MKMKMMNEEMVQKLRQIDSVNSAAPQKGKLAYAIAVNERRLAEASQDYAKIKNESLDKLKKEFNCSEDDSEEERKEKLNKIEERLADELKDIAWIKQEVDIFQVDEETFYSGTLTSRQMSALLWMVEGDKKA